MRIARTVSTAHKAIKAMITDMRPIIAAEMIPLSSATESTKIVFIRAQIIIKRVIIHANAEKVLV